jgi:hypothetical protein
MYRGQGRRGPVPVTAILKADSGGETAPVQPRVVVLEWGGLDLGALSPRLVLGY